MEENSMNYDESESIWKLDGPIGRKDYFWVVLLICLLFVPVACLKLMGLVGLLFPVALILALIIVYLTYVSFAKRFYDITGSLKWGIIISILIFLLTAVFHLLPTVMLFICLLVPGKLIK